MLHRDQIIIQKILSEIDVGMDMMGKTKFYFLPKCMNYNEGYSSVECFWE